MSAENQRKQVSKASHLFFVFVFYSTSFLSTFIPISYLTIKCMFVLLKSRKRLTKNVKQKIKQQRLRKITDIARKHTTDSTISATLPPGIPLKTFSTSPASPVSPNDICDIILIYDSNDSNNTTPQSQPVQTITWSDAGTGTITTFKPDLITHSQLPTKTTKHEQVNSGSVTVEVIATQIEQDDGSNYCSWISREKCFTIGKVCVVLIGLFFICVGVLLILLNKHHFDTSRNLCTNPDMTELTKHPELHLWDQCLFQTMPYATIKQQINGRSNTEDDEISCNCRKAKIDLSLFSSSVYDNPQNKENVTLMIESVFKNWNMLELLYISDNTPRFSINLNKSSHYSAAKLSILHFSSFTVTNITNAIENWANLEYLHCTRSHWPVWPKNFNKINKLSYLHIWDMKYLDELPPNICDMHNLRALSINTNFYHNDGIKIMPDCIVDLAMLHSVTFFFVDVTHMPISLFKQSKIVEISLIDSNVSLDTFIRSTNGGYENADELPPILFGNLGYYNIYLKNNHDYYNWDFEYNLDDQTAIYLTESVICEQYITETNAHERGTLDLNITFFPYKVKEFLNTTKACIGVCEAGWKELACSPFRWQNGVCDQSCNVKECNWDGGDCNQLCNTTECDIYSLFDNRICDQGCNSSYCSFDSGECISYFDVNDTYCNLDEISNVTSILASLNMTDSDRNEAAIDSGLCDIDWIGDGWCDENCRQSKSCNYDLTDCGCQGTICSQIYGFFSIASSYSASDPSTAVSLEELCYFWNHITENFTTLRDFSPALDEWMRENRTCEYVFTRVDANNDSSIVLNEFIYSTHESFNLTQTKAKQINCTCVSSDYGL